ncbi:hypothetical protein J3458_005651 [Metarhizium acridum]|uniref:uncharacterized protein n=1 Tax=Metarhizium acridum TaxID=92637 RepID=UPI001C6BD9E7|nr:hypothetical protein J3458_005651 [Metarhizium acridum]
MSLVRRSAGNRKTLSKRRTWDLASSTTPCSTHEVVGDVNGSGKTAREVEHRQHGRTKPREERNADMWALQRRQRNRSRSKPGGSSVVHICPPSSRSEIVPLYGIRSTSGVFPTP